MFTYELVIFCQKLSVCGYMIRVYPFVCLWSIGMYCLFGHPNSSRKYHFRLTSAWAGPIPYLSSEHPTQPTQVQAGPDFYNIQENSIEYLLVLMFTYNLHGIHTHFKFLKIFGFSRFTGLSEPFFENLTII